MTFICCERVLSHYCLGLLCGSLETAGQHLHYRDSGATNSLTYLRSLIGLAKELSLEL